LAQNGGGGEVGEGGGGGEVGEGGEEKKKK